MIGKNKPRSEPPADIHCQKEVSLIDILKGRKIKIEFKRNILKEDGLSVKVEDVVKTIDLLPGFDPSAVMVFKAEGN